MKEMGKRKTIMPCLKEIRKEIYETTVSHKYMTDYCLYIAFGSSLPAVMTVQQECS